MKQRRSLDYDGLDGILQPTDKPKFKSVWLVLMWTIPMVIVVALSVLLLQKLSPSPTILAENALSQDTEQLSKAVTVTIKQALTTASAPSNKQNSQVPSETTSVVAAPQNSPLSELITSPVPVIDKHTVLTSVEHRKTEAASQLPATTVSEVSALSSGQDGAKSLTGALFTVYFKLDSSKVSTLSKTETKTFITLAKSCPKQISLTGHTCNLGTDAVNQQLGWTRANALKKVLISHGIAAQRIVTASEGMRNPIVPNSNKSGQALNRRVELYCVEH